VGRKETGSSSREAEHQGSKPTKAELYLGWGLIATLLTVGITYVICQHIYLDLRLVYLIAINIATFLLYWYDKLISCHEGATRIPNLFLLGLAAVGGSVGALFGIYRVRHKSRDGYFLLRFWLIVVVQVTLVYCRFFDKTGRCQEMRHELLWQLRDWLS
jgi:uncharacterized membrane protein YsdA (DUF1294 family)